MDETGEEYATVISSSTQLRHAHTADSERKAPGYAAQETRFTEFFNALRQNGYAQRPDAHIAIECHWGNLRDEAAPALALLRRRFEQNPERE